jgi:hypothetical protein
MGSLAADPDGTGNGEAIVLSDVVADRIGEVVAASEDAARAIRSRAASEADLLVRGATREAARKARQTVAAVAEESLPQLEARVSELRTLVADVNQEIERLTKDLNQLADGKTPPTLPAGSSSAVPEPPVRGGEERRALLIAINMASNGASREEAARYLVEHLQVPDHDRLLDAVYGYVGPESA